MSPGTLTEQSTVGIRAVEEIRDALDRIARQAPKAGPRRQGVAAAYRWALSPREDVPIQRSAPVPADPLLRLMAEERLALASWHDERLTPGDRRYARGVAQALGWILGYTPRCP
ncbi:hypothetical protein [Kitasatospora sp. NPDC094015]|uniref:hypothetical protein n=1 Tax=Kitasatospora sp. NPDC094015 TaxID=3155205 RepID=UPI00332AFED6